MPGHALDGIEIAEAPHAEQPIARTRSQLTAFVGRTLRGPVDTPLIVHSFADFQRIFGGLWQPSTLSYAVEQYFENGGRTAVIVRVANGARCCTLPRRLITVCAAARYSGRCLGFGASARHGPACPTWSSAGRQRATSPHHPRGDGRAGS